MLSPSHVPSGVVNGNRTELSRYTTACFLRASQPSTIQCVPETLTQSARAKRRKAQPLRASASVTSSSSTATPAAEAAVQLSPALQRDTVVLEAANGKSPGGRARVYVLGVSHVSRESCEEAAELIGAVRPDAVLLELCKDRLRLLLDQENPGKRLWHTPRVKVAGIPEGLGWPQPEQLISLLRTQPGRPVATQDIEADCNRILETGLFCRCRPTTQLPSATQAPNFVRDRDGHLNPVIPLNQVEFTVQERQLPKLAGFALRVDSSLGAGLALPEQAAADACAGAMAAAADGVPTAAVCARMLPELEALAAAHSEGRAVEVVFRGVESGQIEAVFKAASLEALARPYRSGLEGSAVGGEGPGIEPFRPNRGPLQLSKNLIIENLAKVLEVAPETVDTIADVAPVAEGATSGNAWRRWTADEAQQTIDEEDADEEGEGWSEKFAMYLTAAYAQLQTAAANRCGVSSGEVWRTALEAASNAGAQQVLLGDLPANLTARRLADGVWKSALIGLGLFTAAASAAIAGELTHALPGGTEGLAAGGVAATAVAAAVPLVSPLAQIWLLAQKPKEDIEDIVRMKEPLQAGEARVEIWGEDALLQWPGARRSVIAERDAYMARTIWAAATGVAAAPAYIADNDGGMRVWRYVVPEGGPPGAAPPGYGDGAFQPLGGPGVVVAVVGSAHVRGIAREWQRIEGEAECLRTLNGLLAS